jgi:release factor glutamine methyltransferase
MAEPVDGAVTWRELWHAAGEELGRPQARWVCEVASGRDGAELIEALDQPATHRQVAHFDAMLARTRAGEPLQYVLGRWSFRRLDLMVDRRVLIPRPETEEVTEEALRRVRDQARPLICADLGTGSGAIGLALAAELPLDGVTVWLTDVSTDALDVARANLAGIGRAAANVRIAEGSWFAALPPELRGELALVVANPPYVSVGGAVERIVTDWEPHVALFGGADGLDGVREITAEVADWLRPGGWLVLEIGAAHAHPVVQLLLAAGLDKVEVLPDAYGLARTALARRPA